MAYATYEFYTTVYYGNVLTEENFARYAARASDYLDYLTFSKAKSYDDTDGALAKACCAVAEQISYKDTMRASFENGEIASESVGSHSISYRSGAEVTEGVEKAMSSAARSYLLPTGLLYRGLPCTARTP